MFRDVYKKAMDDIKPRDGLLEEILTESKNKPKRNLKMITSYAASVAAVVVIAMAVVVYPDMSELHKQRRADDKVYKTVIQNETNEKNNLHTENADEGIKLEKDEISLSGSEPEKETKKTQNVNSAVQKKENRSDSVSEVNESSKTAAEDKITEVPTLTENDSVEESVSDEQKAEAALSDESKEVTDSAAEGENKQTDKDASDDLNSVMRTRTVNEDAGIMTTSLFEDEEPASGGGSMQNADGKVIISEAEAIAFAENELNVSYTEVSAVYTAENDEWCVCFYTESEKICVYLNGNGAVIRTTRENI